MDKEEAKRSQLDVNAYHQAVDEFCNGGKQADKLMIVAFEKGPREPAGVALLKKKAYDLVHLRPLGQHPIEADMARTTRKLYWELSYCIRRADQPDESVEGEAPTMRRLEMAEKTLRTGYAFPANHYLVTDRLWEIFEQAIREKKGAFGSDLDFVHPCICRKARHQLEVDSSQERRHMQSNCRMLQEGQTCPHDFYDV